MNIFRRVLLALLPIAASQPESAAQQDPFLMEGWTVYQGTYQGRAIIVRANTALKQFKHKESFPFRLGLAFPLRQPDENGMAVDRENQELYAIEDRLDSALTKQKVALPALVISTGGMREFVFYCKQPESAKKEVEALKRAISTHELQYYIEQDKDWEMFSEHAQ